MSQEVNQPNSTPENRRGKPVEREQSETKRPRRHGDASTGSAESRSRSRRKNSRGSKSATWKEPSRGRRLLGGMATYIEQEWRNMVRLFKSSFRALKDLRAEILARIFRNH